MSMTLEDINAMSASQFLSAFGGVFEESPWIADRAWRAHPFRDLEALKAAMTEVVLAAPEEEQVALIRVHPDLAGKAARAGTMSEFSVQEQSSVGLDRMSEEEYARFNSLNEAYKKRFGFPFIVAVRDHDKRSILTAFETRMENDRASEIRESLRNILRIAELRLGDMVRNGKC